MNTIIGNRLAFKTFDYLKVNETKIQVADLNHLDYFLESDEDHIRHLKELDKIRYGVSEEALQMNQNYLNLYKVYETKTGEELDFSLLRLETDDKYHQLMDRHDLIAGKDSKLRLVLDYHSIGERDKFRNSVIRIIAREKSEVELFIIQREDKPNTSLESIAIYAEDHAKVKVFQYQLGTHRLYTNYQCELVGEKSEGYVNSIFFGNRDDELNILYNMIHRGKKTNSDILVNGALKDQAQKNFKSNLEFKEGAVQSIGSEEEYVILLDDNVHSISVPLMLCHEDDVEGNHAASAGQIDPEILFYLMTRGISLEEAETLIIESKFAASIDSIKDEELEKEIWNAVRKIIKAGK
ncbi:MAG: SufD family Fe-S cluster assembly protein [Tissierellia bacterium]|nr:SufD family Fe-S cluster assembly protein [Tissierellia bacterium]